MSMLGVAFILYSCTIAAPAESFLDPSTEGHFGRAYNASQAGGAVVEAAGLPAYAGPPLTVEFWAKANSATGFNIFLSFAPKDNPAHWEAYTYSGAGDFCVYLPGATPSEIRSGIGIADGKWHYLAFTMDERVVRLYVDGQLAKEQEVEFSEARASQPPQPLLVGRVESMSHPPLGCDGVIDEVRISDAVRDIGGIPDTPFQADANTVGLWRFDIDSQSDTSADESASGNPMYLTRVLRRSMDDVDLLAYNPGPSPMGGPFTRIKLKQGTSANKSSAQIIDLSGEWQLAEGGAEESRLGQPWDDAIPAKVPGSVHTALVQAGRIPDPYVGLNDSIAREQSFKTWWYKKVFARPEGDTQARLVFDGVAIQCHVWLNGQLLGSHNGMFGGPVFDVTELLRPQNTVVVKLDPAPQTDTGIHGNNQAWRTTVVFNNCWGWHYSNIPQLGIWRSVRVEEVPAVHLRDPFIATRSASAGLMDLNVTLHGPVEGWSGRLECTISGETFEGTDLHFSRDIESDSAIRSEQYQFKIPEPRLWWPNDLGEHPLYRLDVAFLNDDGVCLSTASTTFGIRTVRMAPLPQGPSSDKYNWTFVINDRPIFVKGNGWCTMDTLMDFSRERYARFVELAESQHIQMFRAWGSGMPETDDFFDLCDRHGIMVLQEWPTAWNSHAEQPYDVLEETVRLNTVRLRNHPSLVMWGAGNESSQPFGAAIDMMGRLSVELDGTRPFHRAEPWGGSLHNYDCYWGRAPLDRNLTLTADFIGEFGLACMPSLESVLRYLPEAERESWPPPADGSVAHHTPIFNTAQDIERLTQYSTYFAPQDNLEHFIIGSQLSQATGLRHALEMNRTRWPECTGVLYYKMNDNYPAASWSCADWYGVPKIGHYIFQDSFAPLLACVLFNALNPAGTEVSLPVYLLDDTGRLNGANWSVVVRAFDSELREIKRIAFNGSGDIGHVQRLGDLHLTPAETASTPLFIVSEILVDNVIEQRTFYWTNYEAEPGCLFTLPTTSLQIESESDNVVVTNAGELPAVGVHLQCPTAPDKLLAGDGYFWLDPGEKHRISVNMTGGVSTTAWNAADVALCVEDSPE
jgi:beta-mannosidase